MHSLHRARNGAHLSRRERQLEARAEAFSRRTATRVMPAPPPVSLDPHDIALIDRLVRHDRTAVSSALLAIAGIGSGEPRRREVLAQVTGLARSAQADGTISAKRSAQIARHVQRALEGTDLRLAA